MVTFGVIVCGKLMTIRRHTQYKVGLKRHPSHILDLHQFTHTQNNVILYSDYTPKLSPLFQVMRYSIIYSNITMRLFYFMLDFIGYILMILNKYRFN